MLLKKPWAPIGRHLDTAAIEIYRKWHKVYISIGSNIGDKEENIINSINIYFSFIILIILDNMKFIIISKNEQGPASERIRLTFASYEDGDDCLNECYPDDMYFGEDADCRYHEITIQNDWNNFWNLICALCPFFENVGLTKEYEYSVSEILQDSKKLKEIEDQIKTLILEDLEFYMREVFRRKEESIKQLKKGIILLPNNISIRFKGKFHNCLILDNYGFSLGYLQSKNNIAEECYYQDPYTINDDFDRNQNRGYKLLHEICFNPMNNGFSQVAMALRDLIFICGNDFEKLMDPSCRYVMSSYSTTRRY